MCSGAAIALRPRVRAAHWTGLAVTGVNLGLRSSALAQTAPRGFGRSVWGPGTFRRRTLSGSVVWARLPSREGKYQPVAWRRSDLFPCRACAEAAQSRRPP
jgi:hypothetical protein